MIVGHYGLAAAVKAREPTIALWMLMLATVWLDIVFVPFLAAGVEWIEPVPHAAHYGGSIIHADYTHSLMGAALLSGALAIPAMRAWGVRSGIIVGFVALSHWVLDLIVHRGDLSLLPDNAGGFPKLGFALWAEPDTAIALEILIFAVGVFAYWRAAHRAAIAGGASRYLAVRAAFKALFFGAAVLVLDVTGWIG